MIKKETRGRKKVKDKKVSLTITVKKSVIKANGGPVKTREKVVLFLESIVSLTGHEFEYVNSIPVSTWLSNKNSV